MEHFYIEIMENKAVYEVGGANSIPTTFLYSNKIFTYKNSNTHIEIILS